MASTEAEAEVATPAMVAETTDMEAETENETTVVETVTTEVSVTTEITDVVASTTTLVQTENDITEDPEETSLGKREREENTENGTHESKRPKADDNGKENVCNGKEQEKASNGKEETSVSPVKLGPRLFHSGIEMFTYFYDLLHGWISNIDVNKYEYMVLFDLLSKGHRDPESKIGSGIESFQIRFHTGWHSRCYFLVRTDGSAEDFSYRKCVDKLMPLPENLYSVSGDINVQKLFGEDRKWDKKGKGKTFDDRVEKGDSGNKGRGGWRGGKGAGREGRW